MKIFFRKFLLPRILRKLFKQRYGKSIIYLDQMYFFHIFDHEIRDIKKKSEEKINIINNYEA